MRSEKATVTWSVEFNVTVAVSAREEARREWRRLTLVRWGEAGQPPLLPMVEGIDTGKEPEPAQQLEFESLGAVAARVLAGLNAAPSLASTT